MASYAEHIIFGATSLQHAHRHISFLNNVYLQDGDLPPVLDIEHKPKDVSLEDFQRDVLTWLHIVEDKYHVKPIIYTYYKFKTTYLNEPVFNDYPYWIAHYYVDKIEYTGEWKFLAAY